MSREAHVRFCESRGLKCSRLLGKFKTWRPWFGLQRGKLLGELPRSGGGDVSNAAARHSHEGAWAK
jgi:hypothetical protein